MLKVPGVLIPICLRNHARGSLNVEAAVELLIAHGTWLERADFVETCLSTNRDLVEGYPLVWVEWELVPAFLDDVGCASSEARILGIAAELAGVDCGRTLTDLLTSLDERNTRLVLAAVATHNGPSLLALEPAR